MYLKGILHAQQLQVEKNQLELQSQIFKYGLMNQFGKSIIINQY